MDQYKFVVMTNPVGGREEEYNRWYDERHLHDVISIPGIVSAQRFALDRAVGDGPEPYRYLAIYDIESDDLDATFATFFAVSGTERMPISDALAPNPAAYVYRVLGEKVEAKR
jgi:hypothetical protein